MRPGISTHVFLSQRLHPGLLDALQRSGAATIELFAARHHFDYTDRAFLREIAAWFRDTGTAATLHQPIFTPELSERWSRHVPATLSLISADKSQRIEAMDEVKRALESAEMIPVSAVTLHLGLKDDPWDTRALENSLTAIEHIKAFAHPLGVKVLLENLQNEVTTPEHILEILNIGHFDNVGVTLDVGHAHLSDSGLDHAFELLKPRIRELHLHDNNRLRDEHLWPGSGSIDWSHLQKLAATLPAEVPGILEIAHDLNETADSATAKATAAFDQQLRLAEQLGA
jgi:sugar phosphate isomerase/epimerase